MYILIDIISTGHPTCLPELSPLSLNLYHPRGRLQSLLPLPLGTCALGGVRPYNRFVMSAIPLTPISKYC